MILFVALFIALISSSVVRPENPACEQLTECYIRSRAKTDKCLAYTEKRECHNDALRFTKIVYAKNRPLRQQLKMRKRIFDYKNKYLQKAKCNANLQKAKCNAILRRNPYGTNKPTANEKNKMKKNRRSVHKNKRGSTQQKLCFREARKLKTYCGQLAKCCTISKLCKVNALIDEKIAAKKVEIREVEEQCRLEHYGNTKAKNNKNHKRGGHHRGGGEQRRKSKNHDSDVDIGFPFLQISMLTGSVDKDVPQRDLHEPIVDDFYFMQPPYGTPAEFVESHFGKNSGAKNFQFLKGTTTLAFIYEPKTPADKGGIIIAVDSRASAGEYISSKSVMKILDIGDRMVATMAGGAADCQFWTRIVAKYCTLVYKIIGSMIAGYDKRGPAIFKVDSEGQRVQLRLCSIGSGSLNAYGILDNFYQPKMTDEEAYKLGRRAIMHATYRDTGSGGVCNMVHISPTEKIRFPSFDVSQLYYEFASELGRDIVYEPEVEI
uniref:Proteasome endopeptidase complex n=1 Tax=Elaeophora elaphi TaxID=1147741 RepID=A0A158Q8D3_9BILA